MRPPRGADGGLAEGPRRAPRAPARWRRRLKYARRCPDRRHDARWCRGQSGDPWSGRGERMTAVLEGNLDYILLVYALGFVLLAITLLGLRTTVTSPLPWKWLGISAVFLGLSAWTDMFTLAGGHRGELQVLETALFVVGCAFLVEFARVSWAADRGPRDTRELDEEGAPHDEEGGFQHFQLTAMAAGQGEHVGPGAQAEKHGGDAEPLPG